ncbi:MAG TPA: hypothetical protein VFL56_03100 [Solirubrobacterales bacterium]|nr:hypothetical protein [Solirubrobacterales bacterium]
MPIGLGTRRGRAVSLAEGAAPGAERCPACGEPLFVWLEASGFGPREDQLIDRCEDCGLAVPRDAVPSPDQAVEQLLSGGTRHGGRIAVRLQNAASLQAWLGAENWAALAPGGQEIKPTPRAAAMLLARRGLGLRRVRHLIRPGIASMWQTLLNLLTFHRDFASEAVSRRLRPGGGRGLAAFWIDVAVTILAAVPTAILAVLLESTAVIARRGGVIEIQAEPLPDPGGRPD